MAAAILAGCGGGGSDGVVARVGDATITKATLDHWTAVLMGGRSSPRAASSAEQALRQRALALLISAEWVIGEAAAQSALPSQLQLRQRVDEQEQRSFPGGEAERREFQQATGQTRADLELEARVELASSRLRELARAQAPAVTRAQITSYYAQHPQAFVIPEVREVRLTNGKTPAEAEAVIRKVRAGTSFVALATRMRVERPAGVTAASSPEPLARAIYAARPNVLTGPVKQGPDYNIFEVKRVVPVGRETLGQASPAIARQLREASLRHALTAAVAAWRARWRARTSCHPGYVVQKCRQYNAHTAAEDPLNFS